MKYHMVKISTQFYTGFACIMEIRLKWVSFAVLEIVSFPGFFSRLTRKSNVYSYHLQVLLRVDESEQHAYLLFGLVTAFLMMVLIAACCAIVIMTITLMKVGKNKLE